MAWHGLAWLVLAWRGLHGTAWLGMAWHHSIIAHGLAWPGLAWHDLAWHDMACLGLVWLDIIEHRAKCIAKDSYPGSWIPHVGYPKSTQTAFGCLLMYTYLVAHITVFLRVYSHSWGLSRGLLTCPGGSQAGLGRSLALFSMLSSSSQSRASRSPIK